MSNQLHDDTFTPFTITDGRCVVASETEWARIEAAATAGKRILVGDVFAEWDGSIRGESWRVLQKSICPGVHWTESNELYGPEDFKRITTTDIRRRLFSMIDRTPATWCIETRFPE
jgi:hypothetical protein